MSMGSTSNRLQTPWTASSSDISPVVEYAVASSVSTAATRASMLVLFSSISCVDACRLTVTGYGSGQCRRQVPSSESSVASVCPISAKYAAVFAPRFRRKYRIAAE